MSEYEKLAILNKISLFRELEHMRLLKKYFRISSKTCNWSKNLAHRFHYCKDFVFEQLPDNLDDFQLKSYFKPNQN